MSGTFLPRGRTALSPLRCLAAVLGLVALCYSIHEAWTAFDLSTGAPLGWRTQLLLTEGGVPAVIALGWALAAVGGPRARRVGWLLALGILVAVWLWTGHVVAAARGAALPP